SPGIVVVENEKVIYRHIVTDHDRVVPEDAEEFARAFSCSPTDVQGLDEALQNGLQQFHDALANRETSAEVVTGELVFGKKIGRGAESQVYRCTWGPLPVAVKCYKASDVPSVRMETDRVTAVAAAGERNLGSFATEAAALMSLRHRNVLGVLGFGVDERDGLARPFLVTELMPRGSLFDVLGDPVASLPPSRRIALLRDAADGMAFLHGCRPRVVHMDLKSLNLLVAEDWTCKVADFGVARGIGPAPASRLVELLRGWRAPAAGAAADPQQQQQQQPDAAAAAVAAAGAHHGTVHWMAPEVLVEVSAAATATAAGSPPPAPAQSAAATTKADVFAFGVIMWEVATRSRPWLGVPLRDVRDAVVAGHRLPLPSTSVADNDAKWPSDLVALMHDCWAQSPSERPEFRA
ncbi:hypothetical protein HK405_001053, partial [Cladochytrium tenue]